MFQPLLSPFDINRSIAEAVNALEEYAIIVLDKEGKIVHFGENAQKITGYMAHDVKAQTLDFLFVPETLPGDQSRATCIHSILQTANTQKEYKATHWQLWQKKDAEGELHPTLCSAEIIVKALRDEGIVLSYTMLIRALNYNIDHHLIEGINCIEDYAIFILDPWGRILSWNKGAENIKGYTAAEIIGRSIKVFYPPELIPPGETLTMHIKEILEKARHGAYKEEGLRLKQIKNDRGEVIGTRSFMASVMLKPIFNSADNTLQGYIKVVYDLSNRILKEEMKMREMQRISSEERNQSAVISHEMRGGAFIITATLSEAERNVDELIKNLPDPKLPAALELLQNINAIKTAAGFQRAVANKVLKLGELKYKKKLDPVTCQLSALFEPLQEMFRSPMKERNLTFITRALTSEDAPELDNPWLKIDPDSFNQVLINLVNNSLKFTKSGGRIEVLYKVEVTSNPSQLRLIVKISDTGIGMTPEESGRLFQAYTQANKETSAKYGGTGLGLTISKEIVNLMHGDIKIESTPGVGTTFIVTALCEVATEATLLLSPKESKNTLSGRRILVVDDSELNQKILKHMLEKEGGTVTVVSSGEDAISILQGATQFDVVLMDTHMGGMDGLETTDKIRKWELANMGIRVPIIGISGDAGEQYEANALAVGMDDYVTKPFITKQICDAVKTCIKNPTRMPAYPIPSTSSSLELWRRSNPGMSSSEHGPRQ